MGPADDTPLHPLNLLLMGALTSDHLEIAAAPFVQQCMAGAGFPIELDPPRPPPSTYGERQRAAANGATPTRPFFIEDAAVNRYVELGDVSEAEQERFAAAMEGADDDSTGCAEMGRAAASSPLLLTPQQLDVHGEFIMGSILSPSMADAEVRFAACAAEQGIEVEDSGDLSGLIVDATYVGDDDRARDLFALSDRCADDTIDIAEMESTRIVITGLHELGVISEATASDLLAALS